MARLDAEQQRLLDAVAAAHRTVVEIRTTFEARMRAQMEAELEEAHQAQSRAVRRALEAKVPRTRIGREGLGTSDSATVGRVLALTDPEHRAESAVAEHYVAARARRATVEERATLPAHALERDTVLLRVDWVDFRPASDLGRTFGDTVDLRGLVRRGTRKRAPWDVLTDDLAESPGWGPLTVNIGDAALVEVLEQAAS